MPRVATACTRALCRAWRASSISSSVRMSGRSRLLNWMTSGIFEVEPVLLQVLLADSTKASALALVSLLLRVGDERHAVGARSTSRRVALWIT